MKNGLLMGSGSWFGPWECVRMDKILTVNDVAEVLKVKPITVREMFREKRLRAFKVGKAWRTTETMLQQDLEAMARGEVPVAINAPAEASEQSVERPPEVPAEPAPTPAQTVPPEAPAPAAEVEPDPAPEAEPSVEKPSANAGRKRKAEDEPAPDDSQQMLF